MISEMRLEFFKCFSKLVLPLRGLSLLTGPNASGKSTVIQALTLLHQTVVDTTWGPELLLDGSVLSLGTLGDVVDKVNGRRQFTIGVSVDGMSCTWSFENSSADRRDIAVPLAELIWREAEGGAQRHLRTDGQFTSLLPLDIRNSVSGRVLASAIEGLTYISAERMGPRETYPLRDPTRHRTVGPRGELAPGKLHWFQDEAVEDALRFTAEPVPNLFKQTQAWLASFFPGASFDVQRIPGANLVTLGIRTSLDTDYHRPQNVGFGLTHVLPILVACLHARPGDLVIVENPEVHLHPMGQAQMGVFLARAAAAGVQILIETHSDHVLNGVRRAVKQLLLVPEKVALHFFQPRSTVSVGEAQIVSPQIDHNGNIDRWPRGFFDQFDEDMTYLAGLGA